MATKIKISGLTRLEEIDYVNELKPDFASVMLCERYARCISIQQAIEIHKKLDKSIPLIGTFINAKFMDVLVSLRQGYVDIAQLQGTESEEYIKNLQFMSGKPVIKACQVYSSDVIPYAVNSCADHILFGTEPGSGDKVDVSMLKGVTRPFIISGTLNPDNITHVLEELHPWGVNFSSGIETNGVKDYNKMKKAIETVRLFDSRS